MENHLQVPDAARRMLAEYGKAVEFSGDFPSGCVDLSESAVTNSDLSLLVYFPGFAELRLAYTKITDAGLRHVGDMHELETLSLHKTSVSNDGLSALAGLRNLDSLMIGTDPG